jgi:hypothetical protein
MKTEIESLADALAAVAQGTTACMTALVMELTAGGYIDHKGLARRLRKMHRALKDEASEDDVPIPRRMIEALAVSLEDIPITPESARVRRAFRKRLVTKAGKKKKTR